VHEQNKQTGMMQAQKVKVQHKTRLLDCDAAQFWTICGRFTLFFCWFMSSMTRVSGKI